MAEVTLKGTPRGVVLGLPQTGPWEELEQAVDAKLAAAHSLLAGARVIIDLGARALDAERLTAFRVRVAERFSVEVAAARAEDDDTQGAVLAAGLDLVEAIAGGEAPAEGAEAGFSLPNNAHYLRQTIRSGQSLRHFGNVVICGDINPGAEVIATGDIIVFGTLRGVAHAGAAGDEGAQIVAINLRPTQIRIAGFIARSPDSAAPPLSKYPEVARIQGGEIHILPLRDTI
ncbi:MAG: septum site-determining protein MinC [Candidatus Sericytochromatia bacterium]|nr:septum site-determining protein MinC [Candidatus Sericytochromatia bacterium]